MQKPAAINITKKPQTKKEMCLKYKLLRLKQQTQLLLELQHQKKNLRTIENKDNLNTFLLKFEVKKCKILLNINFLPYKVKYEGRSTKHAKIFIILINHCNILIKYLIF